MPPKDTLTQRAHLALWKAWRASPWPTLDEASAYAAVMSAGLDVNQAAKLLRALEDRGDVRVIWNRDLPYYSVIRDEYGFRCTKRA